MSTRAVYTFKDERNIFAVYKHHDGYPSGAVQWISAAFLKSWGRNRFEADELAAAFVAANKTGGGGVYLTKGHKSHGDLDYDYVIKNDKLAGILVEVWEHCWSEKKGSHRKKLYTGDLDAFTEKFREREEA